MLSPLSRGEAKFPDARNLSIPPTVQTARCSNPDEPLVKARNAFLVLGVPAGGCNKAAEAAPVHRAPLLRLPGRKKTVSFHGSL